MHGECVVCGRPTSTQKTKHCKQCHTEIRKARKEEKTEKILDLILNRGYTAAAAAREIGVTREAVRLLLTEKGIKYSSLKKKKKRKTTSSKKKKCLWCGTWFEVNKDGAKVKYCSPECYKERHKELQRERIRAYYQTPKGKAYQQRYLDENRERIRKYFREWNQKKVALSNS